jgi:CRP-like cAMP-binding protein
MTRNPAIRRICDIELFRGLTRTQLDLVNKLSVTLDIPAGRTLCDTGNPGCEFFVLLEGLTEVRTSTGAIARLHPGGWFGELALFDGGVRRANVTTLTDAVLLVFGRREFTSLLAACPSVKARIESSAECFNRGAAPMQESWYEVLDGSIARSIHICAG